MAAVTRLALIISLCPWGDACMVASDQGGRTLSPGDFEGRT